LAEEKQLPVKAEESFNPVKFCKETQIEMKKVSWPSKKELVTHTGVVAVAVFVVCALIWLCDTFFARLFFLILK